MTQTPAHSKPHATPPHELTLDTHGIIHFAGHHATFHSGLQKEQALDAFSGLLKPAEDHQNTYAWLRATRGAFTFGTRPAGLGLCFFNGALEMVTLGVELPGDVMEEGWPTEKTSRTHVQFMAQQWARQLNRPVQNHYHFAWGEVWSVFDRKGFFASAGLRYHRA